MPNVSDYDHHPYNCPGCKVPYEVPLGDVVVQSVESSLNCPRCQHPINLWAWVQDVIQQNNRLFGPELLVGARWQLVQRLLPLGSHLIDLQEEGIPHGAKLLRVHCNVKQGYPGFEKVRAYLNHTAMPSQPTHPFLLHLLSDAEVEKVRVHVLVTWVPKAYSTPVSCLLDALTTFGHHWDDGTLDRDAYPAVILANTAVETRLKASFAAWAPLLGSPRTPHSSRLYQIRGLCPHLPVEVQQLLITLNQVRNQIAHTGEPEAALTHNNLAKCLAAAVLTVAYLEAKAVNP